MKILLVANECNPEWASVPGVVYRIYKELNEVEDVHLVTHGRNRQALLKLHPNAKITFIDEPNYISNYYKLVAPMASFAGIIWPLYHTLTYPVYAHFNHSVYKQFHKQVEEEQFDIVHALSPILPRFPYKIVKACKTTPFILGPVNGGIPYPKEFQAVAQKEFGFLHWLKKLGQFLPGMNQTYQSAARILAGSEFTKKYVGDAYKLSDSILELFPENGVEADFFISDEQLNARAMSLLSGGRIKLLFVGRLVPYKGCDMLIRSIALLPKDQQSAISVTVVGDGPEKQQLEALAKAIIPDIPTMFTGWVPFEETKKHYKEHHLFCFPSIREFGGAVALEAMAAGLPCIIPNYGGLAEYVTEKEGIKVPITKPDEFIRSFSQAISSLIADRQKINKLGAAAITKAGEFQYANKASLLQKIYASLVN